ncbi:hypothetical protein Aduo_005789 [Ancylostoma duodenale]
MSMRCLSAESTMGGGGLRSSEDHAAAYHVDDSNLLPHLLGRLQGALADLDVGSQGGSQDTLPASPDRVFKRPRTEVQNVEHREPKSMPTRGDFGSSGKATVVSVYTPKKDSSGNAADPTWDIYELPPQDPSLLNKYFPVEGEELLQLFHFCLKCGHKIPEGNTVRLLEPGTAHEIQYFCKVCSLRGVPVERWEGRKRVVDHYSEKTFRGNPVAAVAAITTRLRVSCFTLQNN